MKTGGILNMSFLPTVATCQQETLSGVPFGGTVESFKSFTW